jgi:exonuclease SbcC
MDWARSTRPELERRAADAEQAIEAAIAAYNRRLGELRDRAVAAGVEVGTPPAGEDSFAHLRDASVNAATRAASRAELLEQRRDQARQVRDELAVTERRAQLSGALGQHLNAKRFEKWLLNRALRRLVAGASEVLIELSSGAYSLALGDDNNFLVIDHHNADAARSARTLSGGETFLASLSLALSLAEDIAALAAKGSARLDALFLDEGFGTLDADTLEIVAAAIEELGSRGRMVGLVTHVRELAERIPVRFEVRRDGTTSRVEKVTT